MAAATPKAEKLSLTNNTRYIYEDVGALAINICDRKTESEYIPARDLALQKYLNIE